MKDFLLLCTENVHFSHNSGIYIQADGVVVGSTMGPVLAGIFMVQLKGTIFRTLREHMSAWQRDVDENISCIPKKFIEHVLSKLNGYHDNIKFIYEIEKDGNLPFFVVLVIRKEEHTGKVPTMIYIFT